MQGVVEKKNTIPVLSNILIESVGENTLRITGTDLDVTIRCETEADIKTPGSICVQARKLFDIARLLPDASVNFQKEENDWVTVKCQNFRSKIPGIPRENFPEVPSFKSAPMKLPAEVFKSFVDKTIFAITQEPFAEVRANEPRGTGDETFHESSAPSSPERAASARWEGSED